MQIKHNIETIYNNSTYVNTYSKLYTTHSNRYYASEKYIIHTMPPRAVHQGPFP